MAEELKPCPFCGAKAEYKQTLGSYGGYHLKTVYCTKCGASNTKPDTWNNRQVSARIAELEADRDAWKNRANSNIVSVQGELSDKVADLEADKDVWKTCAEEQGKATIQLAKRVAELEAELELNDHKYVEELTAKDFDISILKAELAKHQWVSVEDRLPEKEGKYFITNGHWIREMYFKRHEWRNDKGTIYDCYPCRITHWKPIILP